MPVRLGSHRAAAFAASIALLSLAIGGAEVFSSEPLPTLEMSADGEIQIAVDGTVSDYRLKSDLSATVAGLLDKRVRTWTFEPVVIDGHPVVAKTTMHLSLRAEPAGSADSYRVSIASVIFGEPRLGAGMRPPHYPAPAVRAHLGARVMLALQLDDTGKVTDAQPYQTSLDARASSEADAERWRQMFEQASVTAARSWHYDLSEKVNGKTVGARAIVPVVFYVTGSGTKPQAGAWKAYAPGPIHEIPWMMTRALASERLSNLADNEAMPLDSRFHLKDDVLGKAL